MSKVVEKFLKYVQYDTTAEENSHSFPSSLNQMVLAHHLAKELKEMGIREVEVDENGYLMASLPSNTAKSIPSIGFIAHLDTSPDMPGGGVKPKVIQSYEEEEIMLNENILLSPKDFPELKEYVGQTLITTDGTTLLGADDKAGIAEIMTAVEYLLENPEIKHGTIKIAFTPDEEIGRGADKFDVQKFGADFAYTVDGGKLGELEYENFNAARAKISIQGQNIHPGYAKNKMKNALLIALELANLFPAQEIPATTEGYEGFYHLHNFTGNVESCTLDYLIRDFDSTSFQQRKEFVTGCIEKLNAKYGKGTLTLELNDSYYNMKEKFRGSEHIIDTASQAMQELGIRPLIQPIRGGTDGARLSFMGLPTPNLFTGGHNFHGRYEFIPAESMEKAVQVILKIISLYAGK